MTQKLTPEVVVQLNDLPGFPARPNTTPPAPDRWVLGEWLVECHVNPEAADFASLPLVDNRVGDVRVSLADQAWFIWDGAVWQPMAGGGGGVVSVTGAAPISSTGGFNPVISLDNSGVVAATYGDATNVAQIAVDAKGRITSASNVAISMPSVNVGLGNVAVGDGTGITGSTDLSFVSNVLEVNSQINVTNGGNTLTVQPASIGSDAATLTVDAGTTVQVGGVALVNISGAFALPGVDGANGQVLTTDGAGTASWQTPLTGITGSGANGYLTLWNGTSTVTGLNPATTDGLLWTQNSSTFNSITVRGGGVALINAAGADQVRLEATGSIAAPADAYRALTAFVRSSGGHSTGLSFRRASGFPVQEYPDWFFGNVADSGAAGRSETGKLVVYSGNNTTSPPDGTRSFVAFRWESGATAGEVVCNENLRNHDFNIKGTTDANLFVADASANAVGFGTAAPVAKVDLASGQLAIPDGTVVGTVVTPSLAFRDDLNTGLFSPANDVVGVAVNGTEVARFNQSGAGSTPVLLMGTTSTIGAITVDSSDPSGTAGVGMIGHANAGTTIQESYKGGQYIGLRTRGTKASPTQVSTDDGLLNLVGVGYTDAAGYNYGALVTFKAEQAYTASASGGRIEFHTTLNGTSGSSTLGGSTTERMRITNAGFVGIATSAPTSTFSVAERFRVDSNGNVLEINNVAQSWPAVQGGAGTVLQNDGAGNLSWATPSSSSSTVDIPSTAQEALLAGDLVRFVDVGGTPRVQQADATNSVTRLNPVGFAVSAQPVVGGAVTVRVSGVADVPQVQFVDGAGLPTSPTVADVGRRVFMSPTSGKITLTAPTASGDVLQRAGVLVDGSVNPKVLVQIGDPTLL